MNMATLARHAPVIIAMTKDDLRRKHAGSILGRLWHFLYPLLFLALYTCAHIYVFKARIGDLQGFDYALAVFSGLVFYFCLSEALAQSVLVLHQNAQLLKNSRFPAELFAPRIALIALQSQTVSIFILAGALAWRHHLGWNALWVVPGLLLEFLLLTGLSWILAPMSAIIPDLKAALPLGLLFILFATPFSYTPDMISSSLLRKVMWLNPAFYPVEAFRSALAFNTNASFGIWAGFTAVSILVFASGLVFFRRMKPLLPDFL